MSKALAIIPTYNSVDLVITRIEELKKSSFDKIIVCDDHSEDNTVSILQEKYGGFVDVIAGEGNKGPGGNRNRILNHELIRRVDYLFFVDADCKILYTGDITELLEDSFRHDDDGVVGFGVVDLISRPMRWNYGELMHPVHEAPDQKFDELLASGAITNEQFVQWAPARAASYRLLEESDIKEVGWVAEGCFAIRASLFHEVKGFDEHMRYHETHDFNARVQENGHKTLFNPITVVQHLEHDSRMQRRENDELQGRLYYYQKHWGMSEEVFTKLFYDSHRQFIC